MATTFGIHGAAECSCWTTSTRFATRPKTLLQEAAETMPAGSQLVVSARGEPGLAVGRLRAHRKLLELRTHELAMEPVEAERSLERVVRLAKEDLDTLVCITEGWPAGLYLAALSGRAQPDVHAAVESFAGDDRWSRIICATSFWRR